MKSGTFNVMCPCKPELMKELGKVLAMYKLDFAVVEQSRLNLVVGERIVYFTWFFENEMCRK